MDFLKDFGVSLAAGLAIEIYKFLKDTGAEDEIDSAFEKAFRKFRKIENTNKLERVEIRQIIQHHTLNPTKPEIYAANLVKYERFFSFFNAEIAKKPKAYRHLKEIKDNQRFNKLLDTVERLEGSIHQISAELINKERINQNKISSYLNQLGILPKSDATTSEIIESFNRASILMSEEQRFGQHKIIERKELETITEWIQTDTEDVGKNVCVVTGSAGNGKTNLLVQMYKKLKLDRIPVLAIKADQIEFESLNDFKGNRSFPDSIDKLFATISDEYKTSVLIIDQLDALSLSLSNNRSQLTLYTQLLLLVSQIRNVKVIVSCRKFDLYNDTNLSYLRKHKEINLKNFTDPEIDDILVEKGIAPTVISSKTRGILRTPLYLSIFIFVKSKEDLNPNNQLEIFSIHDLYEELWKLLIKKSGRRKREIKTLVYEVANKMYEKQRLQIGKHSFEDDYPDELAILQSSGVINERKQQKISFFHQSFFDYTLARNFVTTEKAISTYLLERTHQGLYQRSRVKAILNYLWNADEESFIKECNTIIFTDSYRVHIKHLVLNIIGNITTENTKIERLVAKILTDSSLGVAFLNGIISLTWVKFITFKYELNYEADHISRLVPTICGRFMGENHSTLIQFIEKYRTHLDDGQVVWCLSKFPNSTDKTFVQLFDEYHLTFYEHFYALSVVLEDSIRRSDLQFVSTHLIEQIKFHDKKKKEYLDYHVKEIVAKLLQENLEWGTELLIEIFNVLCSRNPHKVNTYVQFKTDTAFSEYLGDKEKDNHSFLYEMLTDNLLKLEKKLLVLKLSQLIDSNFEVLVKIALEVVSRDPKRLHDFGFNLIRQGIILKEFNNGNEHYQYVIGKVVGAIFPFLTQSNQLTLYGLVLDTPSATGRYSYSFNYMKETMFSRYALLTVLPPAFIQTDKQRKKHFDEFVRRFKPFIWEKPKGIGVSLSPGSVPLPDEAYKSFSLDELQQSFKKVAIGDARFRNKYTIYGHAEKFYDLVKADPVKYNTLLINLVNSPYENEVSSIYIIKGMKGLIDSEINHGLNVISLFHHIIEKFEFYEFNYAYEIVQMATNLFTKCEDSKILNFIQELTFRESQNIDGSYFWTTLIEFYVKLADIDEYRELSYEIIERIPTTKNDKLKLALIKKIAWFNNHGETRLYSIFLDTLYGYTHPDLYSALQISLPYMLRIEVTPLIPLLSQVINKLEDKSIQSWYGQLFCLIEAEGLENITELIEKAENKSISYKSGILEHCLNRIEAKSIDFNSFEYAKLREYLGNGENEIYSKYTRLFHYIKIEDFVNYIDLIENFIHSKVRKQDYRDPSLYQLLHKMSSRYPVRCIQLCKEELKSKDFSMSIYYRDNQITVLDILVKCYYALNSDEHGEDMKATCLDMIDNALSELTVKSAWNASDQLNRMIENEA